jgi:glucokinase
VSIFYRYICYTFLKQALWGHFNRDNILVTSYTSCMNYLCVDFGGTKTLVCTISQEGVMQSEVRFETPEHYPDFIDRLAQEIAALPEKFTTGVMAVPGLIDQQTGTVIALGNRPWTHFELRNDLLNRTGVSMTLLNDARLGGLAEARHLIGKYRRVLYITISTGIGGALAVDGELVRALDDTEIGHMPIVIDGQFTSWENVASGRKIVENYNKRASEIDDPEIWEEIAHQFTLGVGPVCAVFQPDAIVFGGGVGEQAEKFTDFIAEELKTILHPVVRQPQALLASHFKGENVIYGCFELGKQLR